MTAFITDIREVRRRIKELTELEARLTAPLLTDLADVQLVYDIFRTLVADAQPLTRTDEVAQRKKFIFIAVRFFAPGVFGGDRFPHGLRPALAKIFDIDPTFISHNLETVCFNYLRNSAYNKELEYLYTMISKQLIASGKLPTFPGKSTDF